jgi:hypothetical protein
MAITKRSTPPAKVTVETQQLNTATPSPAPLPRVLLVNGCSTYVTPEREVFYSRDSEGNPKVYEVTPEQLGRLLSYRDDWGKRFFKQTNAEVTDSKPDNTAKVVQDRGGPAGTVEHSPTDANDDDGEELDTGAMALKDRDGNEVGVTV